MRVPARDPVHARRFAAALRSRGRAFSLVELVIVLVIVGVLAGIAAPRAARAGAAAKSHAVAEHLRRVASAVEVHRATHGEYPPDVHRGNLPPEFAAALTADDFGASPLGGLYDWNNWIETPFGPGGINLAIWGVQDMQHLAAVDRLLDDGDLQTGSFYLFNGRHALYVLQP